MGIQASNNADVDPSVDRYMYPLIIACYWRNGNLAEAAVEAVSSCLDAGVFDQDGPLQQNPHLESIAAAISSLCLQGVTSRFAIVLPFFRKVCTSRRRGGFRFKMCR